MKPRLNPYTAASKSMQAMIDMSGRLAEDTRLDHRLLELVKTRASQINGCAFCLHMHTTDARALGETEQRLYLLSAWKESNLYTPRERAALAWTEALTLVTEGHVPDHVFDEVKAEFTEEEIVQLTLQVTTINAWNRVAISLRSVHPHDLGKAAKAA